MKRIVLSILLITFSPLAKANSQIFLDFLKKNLIILPTNALESLRNVKIEDLYKPLDRGRDLDKREKHLQLTINLYRRAEYGLMLKSIKLFEKNYGETKEKAFHYFLQIAVLENKIKKHSEIGQQVLMLAEKGIKSKNYNINLKVAFYKVIMREQLKKQDDKSFRLSFAKLREIANKYVMSNEKHWLNRIEIELAISLNNVDEVKSLLSSFKNLTTVYRDDYDIYYMLVREEYNKIHTKYKDSKWANYTLSLLNNLSFSSLYVSDESSSKRYLSLLVQQFSATNENYQILKHIESGGSTPTVYSKPSYSLVGKLIEFEFHDDLSLDVSEKLLVTEELKTYIWQKRLEKLIIAKKDEDFLKYISTIPLYKLSDKEIDFVIEKTTGQYLKLIYTNLRVQGEYSKISDHYSKMTIKKPEVNLKDERILYLVGVALLEQAKLDEYFELIKTVSNDVILNELEIYRYYKASNWSGILSLSGKHKVLSDDALMLKVIALSYDKQFKRAGIISERVIASKESFSSPLSQDFVLAYIRVIKSANSAEQYYQRLNSLQSGIKRHGVTMNRVKPYIEAELIGLNMTLKNLSFEKILTKANTYVKNYRQTQFYSMINLVRGKLLARLSKIKESMEVLQKIIKETSNKKIKAEALDELTVLKNI